MPTIPHRGVRQPWRRALVAAAVGAYLVACRDATDPEMRPAAAPAAVVTANVPSASAGIIDAIDRVVPALADEPAGRAIALALDALVGALEAPNAEAARAALFRAETALQGYEHVTVDGGDAVHVDVIALALDRAREELGL